MNRTLIFVLLIALWACNGKKEVEIPMDILPPSKMTSVLLDVEILEASLGLNLIHSNDTLKKDSNLFYNVFENNKISKKQYDESMSFYIKHPDLLNQIYDSVLVKLDAEKDTLKNMKH